MAAARASSSRLAFISARTWAKRARRSLGAFATASCRLTICFGPMLSALLGSLSITRSERRRPASSPAIARPVASIASWVRSSAPRAQSSRVFILRCSARLRPGEMPRNPAVCDHPCQPRLTKMADSTQRSCEIWAAPSLQTGRLAKTDECVSKRCIRRAQGWANLGASTTLAPLPRPI